APAALLERGLEAADLLVAEGEILRNAEGTLEIELGGRVVPHRVHRLRRGRRGAQQKRIRRALSKIVRRRQTEDRHFLLLDIFIDGVKLESGERPEDDVDIVALDEFL